MWLSSHSLRIYVVVFLMRSEEPDHQHACRILHQRNQSIIVRLDVEDHPATLQYAGLWVGSLHILWRLPLAALRNGPPGLILSPSGLDSTVPAPLSKIALDQVGTQDDHSTPILFLGSQKWKLRFHNMEI